MASARWRTQEWVKLELNSGPEWKRCWMHFSNMFCAYKDKEIHGYWLVHWESGRHVGLFPRLEEADEFVVAVRLRMGEKKGVEALKGLGHQSIKALVEFCGGVMVEK